MADEEYIQSTKPRKRCKQKARLAQDETFKQFLTRDFSSKKEFKREYVRLYTITKACADDVYLLILAELKKLILEGNVVSFKKLCKLIDFQTDEEDNTFLKEDFESPENPLNGTNVVILACQHNQVNILEHIFSSDCAILSNLSFGSNATTEFTNKEGNSTNNPFFDAILGNSSNTGYSLPTGINTPFILPEDEDVSGHNAFYYAIRSGNVELVDTLITKWPDNYFAVNVGLLDEVLSRAYGELKLKNVPLTEGVEIFVENKLLNLRFFSSPETNQSSQNNLNNIKERIELVLQNIDFLSGNFSDNEKVDEKFLFVAKFIAQNIHILKRLLKSTYVRVPWEEIEFCLVGFVFSHIKQQEINLFYNATLNKNKILKHLGNFAKKLKQEKDLLKGNADVGKLAELPLLKREKVIAKIVSKNPEFKELYENYLQIRDIHSLEKINDYIKLALLADPKERQGQLVITRVLQILGEYLKNTLESPKLSDTTGELLLLSLPKNTREVIIGLRNSLSHAYSLAKRTEIEENTDVKFFIGVQNDTQVIGNEITDILYKKKLKMIRILLEKIAQSENLEDIEEVVKILNNVELDGIIAESLKQSGNGTLENLVKELSNKISDKTAYEKELFKKMDNIINLAKNKSKDVKSNFIEGLITLKSFSRSVIGHKFDKNSIRVMKFKANSILKNFSFDVESQGLKEVAELSLKISESAGLRMNEKDDELYRITYEIFYLVEFDSGDLNWIQKLRDKLTEKTLFPNKHAKALSLSNDKFNSQLKLKVAELGSILRENNTLGDSLTEHFPSYKKDKKLQAVVEMLVLDIMSILGRSEKHLENNLLFLDDNSPLLTGKCLRNHLAHDNNLLDILLSDPTIAVVLNAEKLITENLITSKKKMGKLVKDDPSKLKDKFDQSLLAVTNQEKMFTALEEGNIEEFKTYLGNGADIKGRNIQLATVFHYAARGKSLEAIKFLLEQKLDVNAKDINGQTPLHIASAYGRENIVDFLIKEAGMNVDNLDVNGKTPLHIAAKNGHKATVEILLKNNADTKVKDPAGNSPLHYAVSNNHINIVKVMLEKEATVDINETMGGFTCLHITAEYGYAELTNFLIENGSNVNAKTDRGASPLHLASLNGHLEVVKVLVLNGADVNCRVVNGCSPLHYAVENGHDTVADLLLNHGANVNTTDKTFNNTPLHYAAKDGYEEIVKTLLEHKANVNISTVEGITPLHFAVQSGHLSIVATLLEFGANISAKDINNSSPLYYAAECNQLKVSELLIKHGAKVNAKSLNNVTPLHAAAARGHNNIVELLIKNKADLEAKTGDGMAPLHAACVGGHKEVLAVLLKNKVAVDAKTYNGMSALHLASVAGHKDIISLLIENKAAVNSKDKLGVTPLFGAIIGGHMDVVKILIENKASVNEGIAGSSPLLIAVEGGHTEIVKTLIKNGAGVNVKSGNMPPLVCAVKHNRKEIVEILIQSGASVNSDKGEPLFLAVFAGYKSIIDILLKNGASINRKGPEDATILHVAAKRGNKDVVNALIANGAIVDAKATNGTTPLYIAVQEGHKEVVEVLIANKASVNFGSFEEPPLHMASTNGHADIVDILIRNGANVSAKDFKNRTSLELAVAHGHIEVVKKLLEYKKVDLNAKGNDDYTILHIASQATNLEMVKFLIEKGCDINVKNASGSKPVHIAAREGNKEIVKYFLSKGSSVDEFGMANQTLLHYAAMNNQLEVVKFLIAKGANCNAKDTNDVTPMHIAAICGQKRLVEVLLKNGAFYNAVDKINRLTPLEMAKNNDVINLLASIDDLFESVKRNSPKEVENNLKSGAFVDARSAGSGTPLHFAAWKGFEEVAKILLQNKADPNAIGTKKFTPLHYATKFGHLKIVKSLLFHGAVYNAVSDTGKTPLDLTKDKDIISLFKLVNESFKKVKAGNTQVICDLNKTTDIDSIKAVMSAKNEEMKTLVAVAVHCKFPKVKQLKEILQDDVSLQLTAASLLLQQGDSQGALRIYRNALEKRREVLGPDNPGTLDIQTSIAKILYKQGIYQEALNMFEDIYQKQKETLGVNDTDALSTRSIIALVLHRLGKDEKALNIFREVYKKQSEILGAHHTETLNTHFHMALVLDGLGKHEEAIRINKAVYEMRKVALGSLDHNTVSALNNVALVLMHQGKNDESLKIYKEVYEQKKLILGPNHADTLRTLHNIAGVYQGQKKYHEALKSYQEVLSIQKKHLPHIHPDILNTQSNIANLYFEQGKWISALKAHKECLDQRKAVFGPYHPTVIHTQKQIEAISYTFKFDGMNVTEVLRQLQNDVNIAANDGDAQTVQRLIENGADPNEKDTDGRTPLHFAVSNGNADIVNLLINNGANVFEVTNKGNTPLHTATSKANKTIVDILLKTVSPDKLKEFVDVKTFTGGTTALHVAAKVGSIDVVKSLLTHGATYDIKNSEGKFPLDISQDEKVTNLLKVIGDLSKYIKNGNESAVDKLKTVKSDELLAITNARNNLGNTLLQVAMVNRRKVLVSKLLEIIKQPGF